MWSTDTRSNFMDVRSKKPVWYNARKVLHVQLRNKSPLPLNYAQTLRGALLPGNEEEGGGEAGASAREQWATCGSSKCVSTLLHLSARPLHIHFMSQFHPPPHQRRLCLHPHQTRQTHPNSALSKAKGGHRNIQTVIH